MWSSLLRTQATIAAGMAAAGMAAAGLALVGCGGSASGGGGMIGSSANTTGSRDVVATVGDVPITRAAVSHWMQTLAGGDYYELSGRHTVPGELVSDPPDYPRCVASLEATAARSPKKRPVPAGVKLLKKCQQLYQALRTQAITTLVRSQWVTSVVRDLGVTVSDAEVQKLFRETELSRFPSEAALRHDLATRKESIADDLLLLKLDLISQKVKPKLSEPGGQQRLAEAERRWTAKTSCQPEYVVVRCKQYRGPNTLSTAASPSPAVLMEQVAVLATGRCVNLAACGRE
jgi:hypothetical protein